MLVPKFNKKRSVPARQALINDVWDTNQRLREYDDFFDNLKEGDFFNIINNHHFYFTLKSWNKEDGTLTGTYDVVDVRNQEGTFEYWEIYEHQKSEKIN